MPENGRRFPPPAPLAENGRRAAVLLVRPQARAAADSAVWQAVGWQGIAFSVMRIEPLPERHSILANLFQTASALFWVSPSAVEAAQPFFTEHVLSLPHIAVGRTTARTLHRAGCRQIHCPQGGNDSEAAAALPVWDTLPAGAAVGIIRGEGGRGWLAAQLRRRGLDVHFGEIYRRVPQTPDWTVFQTADVRAVWITSREMVRLFFDRAPPEMMQTLQSLIYFTHHPRIAADLRAAGVRQIETAGMPDAVILNPDTENPS
ncbi:uroporphyrinogen-III synthase [Neisseria leonii]|uniref:uroporphyrinogen-III synthase n=1 Tax=Neisseria leonii TaxID=2995413 RepID=UPI00237B05E8|nr:uroporphyrinogen-III synthase [Neisseria sp. 3986]MDD9326697.1 uroporphyrinogen-III synthase [Neisseria sp. 3986]